MNECIYTKLELLTKIKAIDTKLESAASSSRLDTWQSVHSFNIDIVGLKHQRNNYYRMLQQYYPGNYGNIIAINTARR